jgi:methylmalonyl-CoA mutase N-terminal domain/subunit
MSFFFAAHNDFLEEIAKFRAARRLWARLVREQFGITNPRAQQLRFHAQTAGSTLTAQQPDNNVVRVTVQALAAVLGGAQSLHCNGRDEALALPTVESATLALRTQQIIAWESGVANTVDPVGGSYDIEFRTNAIEAAARALLARIEATGGVLSAIESGMIQREIQESAFRAQRAIDSGDATVVGVTKFQNEEEPTVPIFRIDPAIEAAQKQRLERVRLRRDAATWSAALERVRQTAEGTSNLMPPIITAVKAGATLGELSDTLRQVFGEHRESPTV